MVSKTFDTLVLTSGFIQRVKGGIKAVEEYTLKKRMKEVGKNDGISTMIEDPVTGSGERHRDIHKTMQKQDPYRIKKLSPT